MKILNKHLILAAGLLLVVVTADTRTLWARDAGTHDVSCSPFKAVYTPSPEYKRDDGIHDSLTLESQECEQKPCTSAKVSINTYDDHEALLAKITMKYLCTGTGWTCTVSLSCTKCDGKKSDHIEINPVALTSRFERVDFYGKNGNAAHAIILPAIDRYFRYAPWDKFKESVHTFTDKKLPLELATHLDTPEVWVLSKCQH